jgi:hypothetical protein
MAERQHVTDMTQVGQGVLRLGCPFGKVRQGRRLLVEAPALEEAGASLATGTQRRSASALAAMEPTNGATWPKEGRVGVVG